MTGAEPLRIMHVETGKHLYGGALQVCYLLEGLQRAGVDNVLVCAHGSAIADAARSSVRVVYEVPMSGDFDLPFVWRLRDIIRRERPAIVHLHSRRGADVLGGLAARLAGVPAILTRRVDNPEPAWLARAKYARYEKVITISRGIEAVLRREGVPADKLVCVRSAVDTGKYRPECEREWFYAEFELDPKEQVIGVVAQMIERKGHRYLIDALPAIVAACPDTRVVFFGKGPLEQDLRARCARIGLEERVKFAGFRTDLERILPCLDLLAHPAEMEGLGVSLLQAAACGVPIVATPAGGLPEVVRPGVNGLLVPIGDVAALAAAVIKLLTDPMAARALGQAGRRLVETEFSIEAMVAGNLAVYRSLLAARGT